MGIGQRLKKIFGRKTEEPTVTKTVAQPARQPQNLKDLLRSIIQPGKTKGAEGLLKGMIRVAEVVGVPPATLAKFKKMDKYKLNALYKSNKKLIQAYFDYNIDFDEGTDEYDDMEQRNIDNISKIVDAYEEKFGVIQ
jgi:hypothetical protein